MITHVSFVVATTLSLSQEYFFCFFPHLSRLRCWFLAEAWAPLAPEMSPCWGFSPWVISLCTAVCGGLGGRCPATLCWLSSWRLNSMVLRGFTNQMILWFPSAGSQSLSQHRICITCCNLSCGEYPALGLQSVWIWHLRLQIQGRGVRFFPVQLDREGYTWSCLSKHISFIFPGRGEEKG